LARQEVQTWLRQYERVYATLDENQIRQLNPIAAQGIERTRTVAKSGTVSFGNVRIEPAEDGQTAFLEASATYRYEWRRAGAPQPQPIPIRWTLKRAGTSWVVTDAN
jgi:hypothetical protein